MDGKKKRPKRDSLESSDSSLSVDISHVPCLTSQQRNIVEMLQSNETRYQWPTQDDVDKVTVRYRFLFDYFHCLSGAFIRISLTINVHNSDNVI